MALPAFRAAGAKSAGTTGAVTVAAPTGVATGDLEILIAECPTANTVSITNDGGGAWAAMTGSPITVAAGERLYVWSRIRAGGDGDPQVTASADHVCAARLAYQAGTFDTSDPFELETTSTETTSDTSFSWAPGGTTGGDDRLVLVISSIKRDSNTASVPVCTNASLTALASRANYCTNSGAGGGFGVTEGAKATAGTIGTFACTYAATSPKSYISFAIKPVGAASITGAAALTGTGSQTVAGVRTRLGAAALTGLGSMTVAGGHTGVGAAALTGTGSSTTDGIRSTFAATALTGTGSSTSAGFVSTFAVAALTGTGTLTADGFASHSGEAALTGTGSLTAAGAITVDGAADLTGVGSLSATGGLLFTGAADLTGTGSETVAGTRTALGVSALTGTGTSTVAGDVFTFGAAALIGNGTLTTNGTRVRFGQSLLTGTGSMTCSGFVGIPIVPVVPPRLAWTGTVEKRHDAVAGAAILSGRGWLEVNGIVERGTEEMEELTALMMLDVV